MIQDRDINSPITIPFPLQRLFLGLITNNSNKTCCTLYGTEPSFLQLWFQVG